VIAYVCNNECGRDDELEARFNRRGCLHGMSPFACSTGIYLRTSSRNSSVDPYARDSDCP